MQKSLSIAMVAGGLFIGLVLARFEATADPGVPDHPQPTSKTGNLVVQLCDGKTTVEVPGVKAGDVLSPQQARDVTQKLMAAAPGVSDDKQASRFTERERKLWDLEQKRAIDDGQRLFHDWKAVGGTVGISCDMCHPNAANTHPESYPKFQSQLKRMATLGDMINWCIENPVKGQKLALDDPKMVAIEAYITAQRQGVPLSPGKH